MEPVDVAVIGAAGTGSRLGVGIPKCLVAVEGKSIVERQLQLLEGISDVRVVVGYREHDVVRHVRSIRSDVTFVRNPNYGETLTLFSLQLAVRRLDRPFLAIDGDLLLEPATFQRFLETAARTTPLIGICPSSTDDAVYVDVADPSATRVTAFRREPRTDFEWTGLAALRRTHLTLEDGHVFRAIEPHLPLAACLVEAYEVDTPDDLDRARAAVRTWGG